MKDIFRDRHLENFSDTLQYLYFLNYTISKIFSGVGTFKMLVTQYNINISLNIQYQSLI